MRFQIPVTIITSFLLLTSCASKHWLYYEEAQACHFNGKGDDCEKKYQKVIKSKYNLPGLHSSYATYLASKGDLDQADREFSLEIQYHPYAEKAVKIATDSIYKTTSNKGNK